VTEHEEPTQTGVGLLTAAWTGCEINPPNSKDRRDAAEITRAPKTLFLFFIQEANNYKKNLVGVIHIARER
jgi:hypothetical protein